MKNDFYFPTFVETFPNEKRLSKRLREYVRYYTRKLWCHTECNQFIRYLNHSPLWAELFHQQPYRINTLLHTYCHKNFNKKQRLEAITTHFTYAEQLFGVDYCHRLIDQREIPLLELSEEFTLYLGINQIDPLEGFFALNIQNKQKQQIYAASFTFLSSKRLLISSIQGANNAFAQEWIKSATKQLYGVRPMFMLITVFKLIARQFHLELLGIPHKNQAKYRWNDHTKLLFNYDLFWQENGAVLTPNKYWLLPTELERKPFEHIASKKRAMYRKRYELFDRIEQRIQLLSPQTICRH